MLKRLKKLMFDPLFWFDLLILIASGWGVYALGWERYNIVFAVLLVAVILWQIPSRYLLGLSMVLLVVAGAVAIFGDKHRAEDISVWAFYAIVIMLIGIMLEASFESEEGSVAKSPAIVYE